MTRRAALALTVANLLAGLLNYLFQVHAAAALDAVDFGHLSAWLAQVTLAVAITTVMQFLSLDTPLVEGRFRGLLGVAGLAALAILGVDVVAGQQLSTLLLGGITLASTTLLYAVVGQLQARLRLADAAAALVATAAFRFGLPFAYAQEPGTRAKSYYVAHASAAFAGVVTAAALVALRGRAGSLPAPAPSTAAPSGATAATTPTRIKLARPVLLAFAIVAFPLVDVLAISSTHDAATTGAFSRIALAARVVFFGGAAVLQILLPYQLHAAKSGTVVPSFMVWIERRSAPALVVGAIALAALVDAFVLHAHGDEHVWLFASCVAAAVLVVILAHVQRLAAAGQLRLGAACVGGVLVASLVAVVLASLGGAGSPGSVARYSVGVLVGDVLVLLFARSREPDSPNPQAAVASRP